MPSKNLIRCDAATLSKDLSGRVYVVTGANSGVGLETTRQLIKQGGHVVMACRRVDAAEEEAKSFAGMKGTHDVIRCDLADLQSVRDFVDAFLQKYDRLDGLSCNAGMVNMDGKAKYTKDGFETTIGISYFGHFLLTELLLDILKRSAPSRMLILSSVVHAGSPKNRYDLHFDDLNYKTRKFSNFGAYGEAKLACVLYAMELAGSFAGNRSIDGFGPSGLGKIEFRLRRWFRHASHHEDDAAHHLQPDELDGQQRRICPNFVARFAFG